MSNLQQLASETRAAGARSMIFQIIMAVAYTALQIALIRAVDYLFGSAATGLGKIFSVAATTSISLVILFLINRYVAKTPPAVLGIFAGVAFFIYFYLIHSPLDSLATLIGVTRYWPSLINMLLAVFGPIVVGTFMQLWPNNSFKPKPLRGSA